MGLSKYLGMAKRALRGEKGRQVLDRAEGAATKAAGPKHEDKIRKARRAADKAIGDDDQGAGPQRRS